MLDYAVDERLTWPLGGYLEASLAAGEMTYQHKTDAAIRDLILKFACQPILFIGSGLSQRYFGAPTWMELLKAVFEKLDDGAEKFEYYRQKFNNDPIEIGTQLSDLVFEWAWKDGRSHFPPEMFSTQVQKDAFLKFLACGHLVGMTAEPENVAPSYKKELEALAEIKPHAIITTNYDLFLEKLLSGYETITGQTILRYNTNSFGEIFHIHGDVTDYKSIVLTRRDYENWTDRKKYVSAKLLTYFAEHPVFIIGYSMGDPNVKAILRDIGELVADNSGFISNVYQVVWKPNADNGPPPEQTLFAVDGKEYRIGAVHTGDFEWVYNALRSQSALQSINPKLVRALAARTMRLIRHDIPSGNVAVDYDILERVAQNETELPKLLGITNVDNPNHSHPFTLTQIAQRLKLSKWQEVNKLINKIKDEKSVDLRSTDNRYHCKIKTGTKETSTARKWSHEAIDVFQRVRSGAKYSLKM